MCPHPEIHTLTPTSSWLLASYTHAGHSRAILARCRSLNQIGGRSPPQRRDLSIPWSDSPNLNHRGSTQTLCHFRQQVGVYIHSQNALPRCIPPRRAPTSLEFSQPHTLWILSPTYWHWLPCFYNRSPCELRSFVQIRERVRATGAAEGNPDCPAPKLLPAALTLPDNRCMQIPGLTGVGPALNGPNLISALPYNWTFKY